MFNGLFGTKEYKVNHLDEAMALFKQVYSLEINRGYSTDVASASAAGSAESYMTQYLTFKERGL